MPSLSSLNIFSMGLLSFSTWDKNHAISSVFFRDKNHEMKETVPWKATSHLLLTFDSMSYATL